MSKSSPPKTVRRTTRFAELPDWFSPRQVQAYLGFSRDAFYNRLKTGDLPHRRFGCFIHVPKDAVRP